jgi:glycine cleavage system H protein
VLKKTCHYIAFSVYSHKNWKGGFFTMEIEGYVFPDDLYYHKEHFWAKVVGNIVMMGTNDFAQKLAGQIVYVELPSMGRVLEQGKPCGSMESGKWVGRIYAPISGKVEATNEALEDTPELINESPYEKGWICKIAPSNLQDDLKNLLNGNSLVEFIKSEINRVKKVGK